MNKFDEEILVVERSLLFSNDEPMQGLIPVDMHTYEKRALDSGIFMKRGPAETDVRYKQIIPYLVFNFEDRYFLMQRKSDASESRLKDKYSLGIGGHLRKEDLCDG